VLSMSLKSVAVKGYLYFFYDILNYILWYINFQFNLSFKCRLLCKNKMNPFICYIDYKIN
jgi:hypothetical protein